MKRVCKNPKCGENLNVLSRHQMCPACRYISRWFFAFGAGIVGLIWGTIQIAAALK